MDDQDVPFTVVAPDLVRENVARGTSGPFLP
jgi:hypothetical protein